VAVAVASLQLMRPSLLALSSRPALLAALLQGPVAVPPAEALAGAHALRAGPAMRGALEAARAGAALEALVAGALGEALRLLDAPASTDALESALAGWVGAGGAAPCGVGGVSVCGGAAEVAAVFSRASPACLARACSPPAAPRTGWGDAALLPAAAGRDAGVERLGSGAWAVRGAAGGGSELVARAALQNGSWLVVWRPLTDLSAAPQPSVPAPPACGCGAPSASERPGLRRGRPQCGSRGMLTSCGPGGAQGPLRALLMRPLTGTDEALLASRVRAARARHGDGSGAAGSGAGEGPDAADSRLPTGA
jgi:hypothetical protein